MAMETIRQVLFAWFDIKDEQPGSVSNPKEKMEKAGMPSFSFTEQEKKAWIKAGMPNPGKFLAKYRKKK